MHFYHAPMALLASFLTNRNLDGPEIQDRTGLAGRYDMVVEWGVWTSVVGAAEDIADSGPTLFSTVAALGLKLEAAKGQTEALVLDHIERPSEN
jgi:bla regulator protein BlaR1